jgi:glycerol-1-phosphate dehydrogenase [NAD(P)+]
MLRPTQISIPTLVRVKPGALDRLGIYLRRDQRSSAAVLVSHGLISQIPERIARSLEAEGVQASSWIDVADNDLEGAAKLFANLPRGVSAIVGVGGGKALDVAKYIGFLGRLPYYAVPTSLSNDGFCSPQSSLTVSGRRRSLPSALPYGIVVDTDVCLSAPKMLTLSGVGDLMSKFTALYDWKLAFHQTGEPVDDFAALLSDGSIYSFLGQPTLDHEGIRLLAISLMLNGISMEICGSSRPASGSEHLISHALDAISSRPRLHGIQVGVATYLMSKLQKANSEQIASVFETTGFWQAISADPFSRREWLEAIRVAPTIKPGYFTFLSTCDVLPEAAALLTSDPFLAPCFVD